MIRCTSSIGCSTAQTLCWERAREPRKLRSPVANSNDDNEVKDHAAPLGPGVRSMDAPNGLDLHPEPRKIVRISRRAGMTILLFIVCLLLAFAYGGYRRTEKAQAFARDAGQPKNVSPA